MANLLQDLPKRGKLPASGSSLASRPPPNYVCSHSTEPSASQRISTAETNLLISCLDQRKQKPAEDRKRPEKDAKSKEKKRRPEGEENKPAVKRRSTGAGPSSSYTVQQLRTKSNQELAEILKQQGRPFSGKKETLIDRIISAQ